MHASNLTVQNQQTGVNTEKCQPYNENHERFIEWSATQGLPYWSLDDQRVVKRPPLAKLARELGVSRQTLYEWPLRIKDFEQRVERAKDAFRLQNSIAVWNAVFLKACTGDFRSAELFLSNFDPTFVSPRYKAHRKEQAGYSFIDLLNKARKAEQRTAN